MDPIRANEIIDTVLANANRSLEQHFSADVMMLKAPMRPPVDDIVRREVEGMKDVKGSQNKLVVLVETSGGFIEVVERIVGVFRNHYRAVSFVVPNYAYSAGTVLVMSGDEIYMDYHSVLGPIDPQYESDDGALVPGMGYLAKYEDLTEKINNAQDANEVRAELAYLVHKFDPAKLFHIEQSIEHSKSLLKEWLPKYKFKDWKITDKSKTKVTKKDREKRASDIAEILGDAKRWHSHGRGITIKELESEEIKLKINNFGNDKNINEHIRHYNGLFVDYIAKRGLRGAIHTKERGLRRTA